LLTESVIVGLLSVRSHDLRLRRAQADRHVDSAGLDPVLHSLGTEPPRIPLRRCGCRGDRNRLRLAPALQASKADLQEALKEGGRGTAGGGRAWIRNTLVVAEVALSLLLLIGASLFVQSFLNLQRSSGGFDTAPLMTMRFYMPKRAVPDAGIEDQRVEDILRRVEALPGVQAAFASNMIPLSSGAGGSQILIEGRAFTKGEEPSIEYIGVSPHMLKTLGSPSSADASSPTPKA